MPETIQAYIQAVEEQIRWRRARSVVSLELRRHLEDKKNPYNTYRIPGLPPGPICSPGLSAIEAALHPERHNYLYFVASGRDRGHVFSTTLAQHNRAVQAYRRALKEKGGA